MLGRVLYKIRQMPNYRPELLYYRDYIRWQILKSAPLTGTTDTSAEVHVLTSAKDWINTVWALKSFYAQVPVRYSLVIHGDPSLNKEHQTALAQQFPDARIIDEAVARQEIFKFLEPYPLCREIREERMIAAKLFDFPYFCNSDRIIMFDSDLLFFAPPKAFLDHISDETKRENIFNPDVQTAYSLELDEFARLGVHVVPEINSGFGLVHRESATPETFEDLFKIPGVSSGHVWRFEQTMHALASSRFGVKTLPEEYRVQLTGDVGEKPYRHYVGAVRDKMYTEGMRKLHHSLLAA